MRAARWMAQPWWVSRTRRGAMLEQATRDWLIAECRWSAEQVYGCVHVQPTSQQKVPVPFPRRRGDIHVFLRGARRRVGASTFAGTWEPALT